MASQPRRKKPSSPSPAEDTVAEQSDVGSLAPQPDNPAAAGQSHRLGKYEIRKKLGSGGMGAVYLAFDTDLKRTVALKVLPKDKADNERLVRRFKAEAQAAAQLRDDNIVAVYEAGTVDGYLYIALEYIEGTDVHQLIAKRGPLPVRRSIEIIRQVAKALQHAHEQGIVHRDIKPSNLLIRRDGVVKLADLGLARSIDETMHSGITRAGTTVGTVDYMAPEQGRDSRAADIRSDIYSLGCTWYQMLTGEPPFAEGSLTNKLSAHATRPPPDPRLLNEAVPEAVVAVLHRMLAKAPEGRHQTPAELLEDLNNPHLSRDQVSNAVLAALSDEVDEPPARIEASSLPAAVAKPSSRPVAALAPSSASDETPAKPAAAARTAAATKPATATMPPRRSRQPIDDERPQGGINFESLKLLLLLAGVFVVVGGLWWIATQFGGALGGGNDGAVNPFAPTRSEQIEELTIGAETAAAATTREADVVEVTDAAAADSKSTAPPGASLSGRPVQRAMPDEPGLAATDSERRQMPLWATQPSSEPALGPTGAKPPVLTVGRGAKAAGMYATLAAAFEHLPASGGIVELQSDGPFYVRPVRLADRHRVTLRAAEGTRPLVIFLPGPEGTADSVLQLGKTALVLSGLDLAAVAPHFEGTKPVALVQVESGDLWVRHCSVTLLGHRAGRIAAFGVSGAHTEPRRVPANSSRVLLDRVFVRGANLQAVELDQTATDFLAANCLFATGEAPVLRLTSSEPVSRPASPAASGTRPQADRLVRFVACTGVGSARGFEIAAGANRKAPPTTHCSLLNSVFTAPAGDDGSVLVDLADWPRNERPARGDSPFQNLTWTVEGSAIVGWKQLVGGPADLASKVQGAAFWEHIWGRLAPRTEFHSRPWPPSPFTELAALRPEELRAAGGNLNAKTEDGNRPGGLPSLLSVPAPEQMERAAAFAHRPRLPPVLFEATKKTIKVDLNRQDLGKIVSANNWPSGTTFLASGGGTVRSSPLTVNGKSFRIEFAGDDEEAALIESRPADFRGRGEAFINVSGGNVEIVGGQFKVPASGRGETPRWFLQVTDGSFSLEGCYLNGPMLDSPRYEGAIRWSGGTAAPKVALVPGRYQQYGRLVDCYLAGSGTLVSAGMRGRALQVRNCVLVSLGDLLALELSGPGDEIAAAIDVQDATLSTTGTFFALRSGSTGGRPASPLRLFVDRTVFAPPVEAGADRRLTLLSYTGLARERRQFDWWEKANGYAGELTHWLSGPADEAGSGRQDFAASWQATWGKGHAVRPLAERGDVLLKNPLPHRSKLGPADFALSPAANAAKWSADGQAIGAAVGTLPSGETKSAARKSDKPAPKTPKKKRVSPDF